MNIGIIGTGKIAARMARTVSQMDGVTVSAVAARDYEKTKAFAGQWGIPAPYADYRQLFDDPSVDLIYVGTPHVLHFQHAGEALMAGKAVLCEKPFTVNAGQAGELMRLSEERGVFITEAMWPRYMPWRGMVDELISSGAIGQVQYVTANMGYRIDHIPRIHDPNLAGGALLDVGVYPVNFATMFLGNQVESMVSHAVMSDSGVDLTNSVSLRYADGRMASLFSSVLAQSDRRGTVCGTGGWIVVDNIIRANTVTVFNEDREIAAEYATPERITGFEYQVRACQRALLEGRIECEQLPHGDTLANMRLLDQARAQWGMKYPFED